MLTKRSLITAATALAFSATLGLSPAFAIGGDDPIEGIDIIVKEDPGSHPIKPFSLTGGEIKQLNALKGADRPTFVLKRVAGRIDAGQSFVKSGMNALGDIWCGPCKMADEISVKFTDAKVTYTLDLNFHGDDIARPTKAISSESTKGIGNIKPLPAK